MDWSKAKNILIVAFIITNLILAYVLVEKEATKETLNENFIEDVKISLVEKNINVIPEIPKQIPSIHKITIEYEIYNPTEIAKIFFDEYSESIVNDISIYISGEEVLTIFNNNKELLYLNRSENKVYDDLSKKSINEIIENFLIEKGFAIDDYKLEKSDYDSNEKVFLLEYVKIYEDKFVETTYMKFQVGKTGIKRFERFWVDAKEDSQKNIPVRSAASALLTLTTQEDVIGKTITEISLCYYFNTSADSNQYNGIVDLTKTKKGQAKPIWRIKFADGTKKFLE